MHRSAVLLAHGFTGSQHELRSFADHLEQQGFLVRLPLLPGHGTTPDDLRRYGPDDWLATLREEYELLRAKTEQITLIGLSVGGSLALKLASETQPASLVVLGAPVRLHYHTAIKALLPVLRLAMGPDMVKPVRGFLANEVIPGYEQRCYNRVPIAAFQAMMRFLEREMTPATFRRITTPTLIIQGSNDPIVAPYSVAQLQQHLGTSRQQFISWSDPYHLIVQGERKTALYATIADWIRRTEGLPTSR